MRGGGGSSLTGISIQQLNTRPLSQFADLLETTEPCPRRHVQAGLCAPQTDTSILLPPSFSKNNTPAPRQTGLPLLPPVSEPPIVTSSASVHPAERRRSTVQMVAVGWRWKHQPCGDSSCVLFMHRQERCCYDLRDRRTRCRKVTTEMGDANSCQTPLIILVLFCFNDHSCQLNPFCPNQGHRRCWSLSHRSPGKKGGISMSGQANVDVLGSLHGINHSFT